MRGNSFYYVIGVLFVLAVNADIDEESISDLEEFIILVKLIKREFKKLNSSPFLVEKGELSTVQDFIPKAESFIKTEKNSEDENEVMNRMEIFTPDVFNHLKKLEEFSTKTEIIRQNNITANALNLMLSKNYKKAAELLSILEMKNVYWVLTKTYGGNKSNFYLIKNTVDEIPSINLSLKILKYFNILIYNVTDVELKLELIKTIKENTYYQISIFPDALSESMILMENIKTQLKPLIVEKLINFFTTNIKNKEIENLTKIIIHDIKDYKYFRQISDDVFKNLTTNDLFMIISKIEDDIPKVIILNSLFEKIYNRGLKMETVSEIITIFKVINESYKSTPETFKQFYVLPDIKYDIAKQLKNAFLNHFYNENEFDEFLKNICNTDSELFLNILEIVVRKIYAQTDTVKMVEMISKSGSLCANILGYLAFYNRMLNKGDLNSFRTTLTHDIYMLNFFLRKTMNKLNTTDVGYKLYEDTMTVFNGLSNIPFLHETNQTFQQYKQEYNFEGDAIDVIEHYETLLISRMDIDLVMRFVYQLHDQPNKMYYVLMDLQKYSKNVGENSIYLFHITEQYKYFLFNGIYPKLEIDWRSDVNGRLNQIPDTIKNIVFCDEVYLKNLRSGGEYLINVNDNVFTSTKGNQTLYSKLRFEFTGYRSEYRIKSTKNEKYLVLDSDEEIVFLAENGTFNADLGVWKLIPSGNRVLIKSKIYNEYLYAGKKNDTQKRNVLANKQAGEPFGAVWSVESAFASGKGRYCTDFPPFF